MIAVAEQFAENLAAAGITDMRGRILDAARHAIEREPQRTRTAAARLATLLAVPATDAPAPARGGLAPWRKHRVDCYLKDNLERPVRVEDLAARASLSASHFCRSFKETFGRTPHAHLIRLRVELAQRLMLATQEPLSQIALASGFADQAHLCKLFRREIGETPSAWRRRHATGAPAETRHGAAISPSRRRRSGRPRR